MPELPVTDCRLLVDSPECGPWNMAVDEYLLGWTAETGRCCWRFYQWKEPTLSLGYFQQYSDREEHHPSRECPIVRRASGGGAILHDKELTYSLTVPSQHVLASRRQWTYETVHQTLIAVLAEWGIRANLFGTSDQENNPQKDFLCFNRRSPGDIVVKGQPINNSPVSTSETDRRREARPGKSASYSPVDTKNVKIVGSAQRRGAEAILQHGSVLLQRSLCAPELPGINETSGKEILLEELTRVWQDHLVAVLGFRWLEDALLEEEKERVRRIVMEKYGDSSWTKKHRE